MRINILFLFLLISSITYSQDNITNTNGIVVNRSPNTVINVNQTGRFTPQDSINIINQVMNLLNHDTIKSRWIMFNVDEDGNGVAFAEHVIHIFSNYIIYGHDFKVFERKYYGGETIANYSIFDSIEGNEKRIHITIGSFNN